MRIMLQPPAPTPQRRSYLISDHDRVPTQEQGGGCKLGKCIRVVAFQIAFHKGTRKYRQTVLA